MADQVADHATLKSQYAAQVTADLEHNTAEQERISSELEALQRQLDELRRNHTLLLSVQETLAAQAPDASGAAGGGRKKSAKRAARVPKARAAKGQDSASGKGDRRAARSRAAGEPTLRELVSAELARHNEPRSAAEVTSALASGHPDRDAGPTVVRNTLEALVAKGLATRSKQQKSVFYSVPAAGAADAKTAKADAPAS